MNVAVVSPVLPWPLNRGNRVRIFNMISELATRHEVGVISCVDRHDSRESVSSAQKALRRVAARVSLVGLANRSSLGRLRHRVSLSHAMHQGDGLLFAEYEYGTPAVERAVAKFLGDSDYDAALVNYWYTAPQATAGAGLATVCETHDVISESAARQRGLCFDSASARDLPADLAALVDRERRALSRFDALVTVHDKDRATIAETLRVDRPTTSIAHVRARQPLDFEAPSQDRLRVLFYGALQSPMNRDATTLATEVMERVRVALPEARLLLAGSGAGREVERARRIPWVEWLGETADVAALLHGADVLLLPLRMGSGLKGRVLEAMEAGLPVVGTEIAAEGIPVTPDREMVVADDPIALADAVVRLLRDLDVRHAQARAARDFVTRQYSWENTYGRIHGCLEAAFEAHRRDTTGDARA
jgi:polysaccharide biosynthesis protein PslH